MKSNLQDAVLTKELLNSTNIAWRDRLVKSAWRQTVIEYFGIKIDGRLKQCCAQTSEVRKGAQGSLLNL